MSDGLDFRAVFEVAADGILVAEGEGIIVEANPELLRQFGYLESELIGHPIELLVPESMRGRHVGLAPAVSFFYFVSINHASNTTSSA